MDDVTLTDEFREFCVAALTSTSRKQCTRAAGRGELRCALGIISEAAGHPLVGCACCEELVVNEEGYEWLRNSLPRRLREAIPHWNDYMKLNFDEIAKKIKDWQP